jgi:hypothetical protein
MGRRSCGDGIPGARNAVRTAMWAVGALLLALIPAASRAQGTARSINIDTSIRAAGMGGASAGVTWGDPNVWGNVASLSRMSGARWEHGSTRLVPGLVDDVWLRSDRLHVGAYGVGVSLLGVPAVMDGVRLDYGTSEEVNDAGQVIGRFSSFETVNGQALAFSLPKILDALAPARRAMHLSEVVDLSLGLSRKRTHVELAPARRSGIAEATTYDYGVQARFSPLSLLPAPANSGSLSLRDLALFDLGLGYSMVNAMGEDFVFAKATPSSPAMSSPATRMRHAGVAMRLGVRVPRSDVSGSLATLLEGFDPLVAVGFASDHDACVNTRDYKVTHGGYEITIANVFTIRRGRRADPLGSDEGPTRGWGIGIPLGPWAGFRYDEGTAPQATTLPDVTRRGWTAWCDAVRVWQDFGSGGRDRAR